ncbi:MAG: hypothetical protein DRP18_02220 [Candidatus Aenigmatarchaeota archaeon]|nr:MAG: hypothetical protein DRP18_02220 [Candidatus Aenigmarchaeota archaeon]
MMILQWFHFLKPIFIYSFSKLLDMKKLLCLLFAGLFLVLPAVQAKGTICAVYFTGIGCPHCAKTDPVLLGELPNEYPDFVLIEYEIYQERERNANLMLSYDSKYKSGLGIPLIIFNESFRIIGDTPILKNIRNSLSSVQSNDCPLLNGKKPFGETDINSLPGSPKIWSKERILIKYGDGNVSNSILRDLLTKNITSVLKDTEYEITDPVPAPISGGEIRFQHAVKIGNWIFEWNGEGVQKNKNNLTGNKTQKENGKIPTKHTLTLGKIISLALVDSVNPCALAVLTLILIAILTYNPKKKRNVLFAGLAFTFSVLCLYLVYGLVIIKFFQVIQTLTSVRLFLYKALAVFAVVLGVLNIKDFLRYKPGGFLTEMPVALRPKVKQLINKITSPAGAFVIGVFVTLFLLPCTIGPYVIAGGILSALDILETLPWLLIYNFIFVLPMIIITLVVYFGITKVEDVSGWKEKNIRYLHFIAGIIMFLLGVAMFFGLI